MSLTKIGSIGINTGIAFAGVTTIVTLNTANDALSIGATVNVGSGITLGASGDIFATGVSTVTTLKVGSGVTVSSDGDGFFTGIVTATSFSGSGTNLTGIDTDLVSDTSPQLGGDLASNGHDLKFADASGYDGNQIYMGSDNDVRIHHDGSNFSIAEATGDITIQSADDIFLKPQGGENGIRVIGDGAVELYHNNTKRLETTSSGVEIPQALFVGEKIDMPDHTTGSTGMILLGTGDDLFMYHDGTNSHLRNNTGTFNVRAGNFRLTDTAIQHVYLNANSNGNDEIALYYDNSVKLTTASNGIDITGMCTDDGARHDGDVYFIGGTSGRNAVWDMSDNALEFADNARAKFGSSDDLQIFHVSDGISKIEDSGGGFHIRQINGGDIHIHAGANNASSNNRLVARSAGAAELYHTGSKKLETTSTGVEVTGKLQLDDGNGTLQTGNYLSVGTGEDLRMFHAGGDSYLRNFGGFFSLGCSNNADLKIVTNGSNRWIFQNDGQFRPDSNNSLDIGTTNYRVRNIYTNDLNLSNKGSTNSVDNTWGDYTIQEGESDLFLINNRNGKKYKFNLTEVS